MWYLSLSHSSYVARFCALSSWPSQQCIVSRLELLRYQYRIKRDCDIEAHSRDHFACTEILIGQRGYQQSQQYHEMFARQYFCFVALDDNLVVKFMIYYAFTAFSLSRIAVFSILICAFVHTSVLRHRRMIPWTKHTSYLAVMSNSL